jgi:hypothetical protein
LGDVAPEVVENTLQKSALDCAARPSAIFKPAVTPFIESTASAALNTKLDTICSTEARLEEMLIRLTNVTLQGAFTESMAKGILFIERPTRLFSEPSTTTVPSSFLTVGHHFYFDIHSLSVESGAGFFSLGSGLWVFRMNGDFDHTRTEHLTCAPGIDQARINNAIRCSGAWSGVASPSAFAPSKSLRGPAELARTLLECEEQT